MQDLPGALDDAAVAEGLGLSEIENRDWAIFKTSAVKGDGLFEGMKAIHLTCMYLTKKRPCGLLLLAVLLLPCVVPHPAHLRLYFLSIAGLDWLTTSLKGS